MGDPGRVGGAGAHRRARRAGDLTARDREARTEAADALCAAAFAAAVSESGDLGMALVAVGGYGRRELAPFSDLDVVLVHADDLDPAGVADAVWYALWDAHARLDHAVRAESAVTDAAKADLRVALGLLDARHLAGDPKVTSELRRSVLAQWRRGARARLPELRELVRVRASKTGELAHASVPDLKEAEGGLRDATVLNALVMTWLVDVPHVALERCRQQLLDVRDVVRASAGRATDRVGPEHWGPLADELGLPGEEAAQRHVREIGRRITHLSRLTWHRVDAVLARPSGARAPALRSVAPGVALSAGEVVLDRRVDVRRDPRLLLRSAAEAAERRLVLSPATASRLARESPPLPEPWSPELRNLFVRLLASGPGLLPVWETLEETGATGRILPEWERVRLLQHASAVHRFTVDRHLVETCREAARLIRRVSRPDLLLVAALLHDIGKGGPDDHSVAGAPVAASAAVRMGLLAADVKVVAQLVRWHLLLAETATTRDLEDPATAAYVVERVGTPEVLDLLEVLTEADARATGPQAWTGWRARLVADLTRRVRDAMAGRVSTPMPPGLAAPAVVRVEPETTTVRVAREREHARVTVTAPDRVGLMAAVAGAFSVQRVSVLAARAWTEADVAVSVWDVDDEDVDPAILRQRVDGVLAGRIDPAARLRARMDGLPPVVQVRHEASRRASVLEVRVDDRPGVLFLACRALADLDLSVCSAHVTTIGPQTLDVFYVQEPGAGAVSNDRAAAAAHAVRRALSA